MIERDRMSSHRRRSLFRQVLVTFVLTLIAAVFTSGFMAFQLGRAYGPRWVEQTKTQLEDARIQFEQSTDPLELEDTVRRAAKRLEVRLKVNTQPRAFLRMGDRVHLGAIRQLRRGEVAVLPPRGPIDHPRIIVPLFTKTSHRLSAIVIAQPRSSRLAMLMIGTVGGLLVVFIGAWLLSRSLTQRVINLERTAQKLAAGDLSARTRSTEDAYPRVEDELDSLARTLDTMAARINALVDSQRILLTNVSHELRTPISRMRVLAELMQDRPRESNTPAQIHTDAQRLHDDVLEVERLVQDLLTTGRLELGEKSGLRVETIDMAQLMRSIASRFDAEFVMDASSDSISMEGDAMLIERVLSNLLANARRACPSGTPRILVHATSRHLEFAVEDEGPGIPVERREEIFQPFVRLDAARARDAGGTGLGLYLSQRIVAAHGGEIRASSRQDGASGARLEVRLPITQNAPPSVAML